MEVASKSKETMIETNNDMIPMYVCMKMYAYLGTQKKTRIGLVGYRCTICKLGRPAMGNK